MKKLLRVFLVIVLIILVSASGLVAWLSAAEFKPAPVETLEVRGLSSELLSDTDIRVMSWNIGYAGLGAEADFFMDGGKSSRPHDNATVNRYLSGIADTITAEAPDLVMLQEVDSDSGRTYRIDETTALMRGSAVFALNYACPFVPVPVPPMGRVYSGLFTTTDRAIERAERVSLPCPFSWPLRIVNLKRCLLVSYLPIEDSDKQLVLVNLHLEAYDSGEGKIAQTNALNDLVQAEYEKGNYVIAGGDFNQSFPGALDVFLKVDAGYWSPGVLEESMLPDGWQFAYDLSVPTCRLLNQPYQPDDTAHTQYYTIDGFLLSPNVELISVSTLDCGFVNSDHNPVMLRVNLKGAS